jgi:hypothetical protein
MVRPLELNIFHSFFCIFITFYKIEMIRLTRIKTLFGTSTFLLSFEKDPQKAPEMGSSPHLEGLMSHLAELNNGK